MRPTRSPHPLAARPRHARAWLAAALVLAAGLTLPLLAAEKSKDIPGSRAAYVHRLPLMDQQDPPKPVNLGDEMPLPMSFRGTCTKCHDYSVISRGWHFSATDPKVDPGRPGEPWFWADAATGTQLPLSYRAWPNTWRPEDVGLKPWGFVLMFGHHLTGGGPGELTQVEDPAARWGVSGKLEINCQSCHSGDPQYDQIEWYLQVGAQNFMWAPVAPNGLGSVSGQAAKMPGSYDPFIGPEDDQLAKAAPAVRYDKSRFDSKGHVFFNIPGQSPSGRCYFCHSTREVGKTAPEMWKTDQDVHLKAGLACADCHRNGPDHAMRRGYEGEPGSDDPRVATLTCRGCHLGDQSAAAGPNTMGGRLGAPVPQHVGLPTIHLKNLACTTCHSGPYPQSATTRVQTSRAHALEYQGDFRGDDALPFIENTVFARRPYDGLIGPERMVWPAFWARVDGDKVAPLSPEVAYKIGKDEFDKKASGETAPHLTRTKIAAVLALMAADKEAKGEPVYIAAGRLWRRGGTDIVASESPAAAPVAWPIAHDVRPKGRSLGSGGCTDCHTGDSPIFFGQVVAETPADLGEPTVVPMYEFLGKDPKELKAWAMSYQFRPMFKVVGFVTAGLIGAVLLAYLLTGLVALARWAARRAPQRSNQS